jgi:phospholipase/carboxylesterase
MAKLSARIRIEENVLDDLLPALEVETRDNPSFAVIWMHGLGADGSDFEAVVPELGLENAPGVRFVFPHAPFMPVTCNGGYVMRAWYDILELDVDSRRVDVAGVRASREAIRRLIAREVQRGIPASRIFLAGFSQGGALAYTTALTHGEALAGVIAMSTYIPVPQLLHDEATPAGRAVPILAIHGTHDEVVSFGLGQRARELLTRLGYKVAWLEYPIPHSICLEEIEAVGQWLSERMAEIAHG